MLNKATHNKYKKTVKTTGMDSVSGKSNKLGHGGRSAQLKRSLDAKGLPKGEVGAIIGNEARAKQAAPGQKNFHGNRK